MQFKLNEIQAMIRDGARRLLLEAMDSEQKNAVEISKGGYSATLWKQMSELGWAGAAFPEDVGGGGMGLLDVCILAEEIGRSAVSLPLVPSAGFAGCFLQKIERSEFVETLLSEMATGGSVVVPALIGPGSRNERSAPLAKFKSGDDGGFVSGTKIMVPFAKSARALLVATSTEAGEIVIVALDSDAKGVNIKRQEVLGGNPLFLVELSDVAIAEDRILARGERAQTALNVALDAATILSIAEVVGNCEGMLLLCAEFATMREQFGSKIGSFQAVSHPIADMRIQTDALRLLVYETAWLLDQGRDVALEVAEAKALANEEVIKMVHAGHSVHGAIGYTMEYDLQLFTRRARSFCLSYGDTHSELERAAVALGL